MSKVEAPVLTERGGFTVVGLCVKLLYWQGFWFEDSPADLEFYQRFFSPRVAQLLVKYGFLRAALRFLHTLYRIFTMVYLPLQIFFLFPMGMFMFRDNKVDLICNCYELIVCAVVFAGMATVLYHNRQIQSLLEEMNEILAPDKLDNEEQKKLLLKTHVFCHKMTKWLHVTIPPFVAVTMIVMVIFYFLPNRTFPVRDWYPFDSTVTPNFEIALTLRVLETILFNTTANTLISVVTGFFIYISTYFKILIDKLQNVRSKSIHEIQERHMNAKSRKVCKNLEHYSYRPLILSTYHENYTRKYVFKRRSALATHIITTPRCPLKGLRANNHQLKNLVNQRKDNIIGLRSQSRDESVSIDMRRVDQLQQLLSQVSQPHQLKSKSHSHQIIDRISHNVVTINKTKVWQGKPAPGLKCQGKPKRTFFITEREHAHHLLNPLHGRNQSKHARGAMVNKASLGERRIFRQPLANTIQAKSKKTPWFVLNNLTGRISCNARKLNNQEKVNRIPTRHHKPKPVFKREFMTDETESVHADRLNKLEASMNPLYRTHKIFPTPRRQPGFVRVPINRKRADHLQHLNQMPRPRPRLTPRGNQPIGARYDTYPLLRPLTREEAQYSSHRASLTKLVNRTSREQEWWNQDEYLPGISCEELDREMKKQLAKVIDLHSTLLRIAKDLGSCINWYLTVMFVVNTLALAVTALFLSTVEEYGPNESIFTVFSIEIMMLYLMHNYMANLITDESQALGEAIYFTDWTGVSPSFKKSLLIVMSRTNKPLLIKPPGLEPLSLKLFAEVTISAYKMMSTLNRLVK